MDPVAMTEPKTEASKTLKLKQTWFLGVMAIAVILMFAFVILPYTDPKYQTGVSGEAAQDFDLELLTGGAAGDRVRLSDFKGRTVLIDFWASWCQPCRAQSQVLAEVAGQLDDTVYLLGVATSDQRAQALSYAKEEGLPYANAYDEGDAVGQAYQISHMPTLVVIDRKGQIRGKYSRLMNTAEVLKLVEQVSTQ